jgi:hypothetical protein
MPIPNDTSPEAERVQIELLRRAGPEGRFRKMASLTHSVLTLSKRAIARQNPNLSALEQGMIFVKFHYGAELESRVREFLRKRGSIE